MKSKKFLEKNQLTGSNILNIIQILLLNCKLKKLNVEPSDYLHKYHKRKLTLKTPKYK